MNKYISLKELRLKLTDYTNRIEKTGDSYIVLKRSKPVFQINPIDEQGWETVVDFTEIDPNGVPAKDVLKALNKLSKQ